MKRLAILVLLVGCSKSADKAPTCAEVTDHMLKIVQIAYPGHGEMSGRGNRETEIQQCETREMSTTERRCIISANTPQAIAQCRRQSMNGSTK